MYFCSRRSRGILERAAAKNIIFRRDCTYKRMLDKCIEAVYSTEETQDAEFFIADSRGSIISETIELDSEDGVEELPWTLMRYISISNVKYPSKARFYCLRKG